MLAEISLKNYLHVISKRLIENELFKQAHTLTANPLMLDYMSEKLKINQLDLSEYKKAYEKAKIDERKYRLKDFVATIFDDLTWQSVEALTMDSIDALDDEYFLDEEEPEAL